MKKQLLILCSILISLGLTAQTLSPKVFFQEHPRTHNVKLTTDGEYLYTCNGGKAHEGMINKYTLNGQLLESYDIYLDMRSIMYNAKDKCLYIAAFDRNIYKITDLSEGSFVLVHKELYEDGQANLALDSKGKNLYYMSNGSVIIYDFKSGKEKKRFNSIDCGKYTTEGSSAIAVGEKHFYTWNAKHKIIFVYDMKGKKVKNINIANGDYGFSLSYANGMLFVAVDGDYEMGTWYGYEID